MAFALQETFDKWSQRKKKEELGFKKIGLMKIRKWESQKALIAEYNNVWSFSVPITFTTRICDRTRQKALAKGLIQVRNKVNISLLFG